MRSASELTALRTMQQICRVTGPTGAVGPTGPIGSITQTYFKTVASDDETLHPVYFTYYYGTPITLNLTPTSVYLFIVNASSFNVFNSNNTNYTLGYQSGTSIQFPSDPMYNVVDSSQIIQTSQISSETSILTSSVLSNGLRPISFSYLFPSPSLSGNYTFCFIISQPVNVPGYTNQVMFDVVQLK